MLCLCAAQLKFWFQTDLGRKNSASCYRQGRQLLLTFLTMFHALVTLYVQFLCYDWSKFDRWVHGENLCSILRLVYFDRVLCQLVMFLTVFFTGCTKWNTAAIKSLLLFIAGLFIVFLVEKCATCQSRMTLFLFFTLLDAWAIFLSRVHLWKQQTPGSRRLKT